MNEREIAQMDAIGELIRRKNKLLEAINRKDELLREVLALFQEHKGCEYDCSMPLDIQDADLITRIRKEVGE